MKRVITIYWLVRGLCPARESKAGQFRKAAVVWVDCDLYSSSVSGLNFLTPHLQYGTLVFFDDWLGHRSDPNRCEQRRREFPDDPGAVSRKPQ